MARRNRFLFEKISVSSAVFNAEPDLYFDIINYDSLLFINENSGIVEISFNGTDVHSELNPFNGTGALIFNDPVVKKIWFRLKSGTPSIIRIQADFDLAGGGAGGSGGGILNPASGSGSDAFGRLRISAPFTLFESKQIFDNQPLLWNTSLTGGGLSSHSAFRASSTLSVALPGDKVIRQTRNRFTYQNSKSLLLFNTFVMGPSASGVSKKVGYFDDNNGIYLEDTGSVVQWVIRSKVSGTVNENAVTQANWNVDKMDGTGPSGLNLDVTKAQISIFDIEWLGVGTVRCGFVIDGIIYYVHKFQHANIASSVYMSTPNLPLRYEIENISGSASSLEQICSAITSEGGYENAGASHSADRGISSLTNVDNARLYPILSIRLKSGYLGTQIAPRFVDVFCSSSNANFKWSLVINPTINGVDAASWAPINNSSVEYDVSRTITNYVTGGYTIASGYGSQKATAAVSSLIEGNLKLGSTIAGVSDQLVLAVQKFGGGTDSFAGALNWQEFI